MKNATTQYTSTNSIIKFEDMLKAVKEVTPAPIGQIKVGTKFYENLVKYAERYLKEMDDKNKLYVSDLYGVKIFVDPELKPNEYRITTKDGNMVFQILENETIHN
jgi:hypothetical protein